MIFTYQKTLLVFLPPKRHCLYETNLYYEGGHSIAHSIFKTSVQRRKDHFSLLLNTNTRSGKSKNANQIDCKIMHFLVTQTLSQYISTIVLDDSEKISINEVVEVLIGVGTFTSTSSFDTQSLQFLYNEWLFPWWWHTVYVSLYWITLHPRVFLLISSILNIVFSLVCKHRIDWFRSLVFYIL